MIVWHGAIKKWFIIITIITHFKGELWQQFALNKRTSPMTRNESELVGAEGGGPVEEGTRGGGGGWVGTS